MIGYAAFHEGKWESTGDTMNFESCYYMTTTRQIQLRTSHVGIMFLPANWFLESVV